MKSCRICQEEKAPELFVKNKAFKSGIDTICLDCSRQKVKEWRKKNPEKRKIQLQREYTKDYSHTKHLKANYGITHQDYMEMFIQQDGACAICFRHQSEFKKRLFVDHCHETGKIRQLLCSNCNTLLGGARDRIDVLQKAIDYLRKHHG